MNGGILLGVAILGLVLIVWGLTGLAQHAWRKTQHGPVEKWQRSESWDDGQQTIEVRQDFTPNQLEALIIVHTHNECYVANHGGDGYVCIACSEWLVSSNG